MILPETSPSEALGECQLGFTIVGIGLCLALAAEHLETYVGSYLGLGSFHLYNISTSAGLLVILVGLVHSYLAHRGSSTPLSCPKQYLKRPQMKRGQLRLVCLGDSNTAGTVSSDYCRIVQADLDTKRKEPADVVNAGVNGHCAWNMLQRIDPVVQCDPTHIFVLAGTNDVKGAYNEAWGTASVDKHGLPEMPSIGGLEQDLQTLLASIKVRTKAKVAVATLPPMGEDLGSDANSMVITANAVIERLAAEAGCQLLPLHSKLLKYLAASPAAKRPAQPFEDWPKNVKTATAQVYLLGRSWNACGERLGFRVLSDGLHLNDVGGAILANLIGEWLASDK